MAKVKGDDDDMTIFEVLSRFGHIMLGDAEEMIVFVWGGEREFHVFQHGGRGIWYRVDNWTVPSKPMSRESAVDRCRERLSEIMADQGMNEFHDMLVDKRKAHRAGNPGYGHPDHNCQKFGCPERFDAASQ